jgi:hypothetical protein
MILETGITIVVVMIGLLLTGCSGTGSSACACPKPVAYDDATIKKITAALRALPPDSILHQAMDDYEDERDNLRFCPPGTH